MSEVLASPVRRWRSAPPDLRPYVDRVWAWRAPAGTVVPAVLPGTGAEVFVHVGAPFVALELDGTERLLPAAHLLCLRSRSVAFRADGPLVFVAARLRTGALRHVTAVPPAELGDRFVALDDVLGPAGAALPERVHDAGDLMTDAGLDRAADAMVAVLRAALAEHAAPGRVDAVLARLYRRAGLETVAATAAAAGVSVRTLERAVRSATGLGPKRVQRIARLHHVARAVLVDGVSPLDAALSRGFVDQAHLIRDARDLTGRTPGALFAGATHFYNPRLRPTQEAGPRTSGDHGEERWRTPPPAR